MTQPIQIIVVSANRRRHISYKFNTVDEARGFVATYNLEDRIVDIL